MAFDQAKADEVCALVANGDAEAEICRREGFPDRETLRRWRNDNPEFAAAFARARQDRAYAIEDRTQQIEADVLSGAIEPQAAYTALRNMHWRAKVCAPKTHGDKIQQEIDATIRVEIADPAKLLRK